ncbi:transporter substrate-binding domain-containing protein [Actinosynnema sp. NPDC047251]|uniref:substrate-binding periplasmic protein n=1 Tax=Saccharothrix espanaensis TaxID=103731 RepID=UPI00130E4F43|nr:transporter substrate-binding domain-containing protein [Saccharothrix espanaensis]
MAAVVVVAATIAIVRFVSTGHGEADTAASGQSTAVVRQPTSAAALPPSSWASPVRIGINGSLPGWSYPSSTPDGYDGFDVALIRFIKDSLHIEVHLVPMQPGEREKSLLDGTVDLVVANFSMDGKSVAREGSARKDVLAFAGPYFRDRSGIMLSTKKLYEFTHQNATIPSELVCVVKGTTAEGYMTGAKVRRSQAECFEEIGKSDEVGERVVGAVTDETIVDAYKHAKANDRLAGTVMWDGQDHPISPEMYGIGMRKGDPARCRELGGVITEFLVSQGDPWHKAFYDSLGAQSPKDRKPTAVDPTYCG